MRDAPLFCKGVPRRGPGGECTCNGCHVCEQEAVKILGNSRYARWLGREIGRVQGCTCDIDWSCVYGDHERACWRG